MWTKHVIMVYSLQIYLVLSIWSSLIIMRNEGRLIIPQDIPRGLWKDAGQILQDDNEMLTAPISSYGVRKLPDNFNDLDKRFLGYMSNGARKKRSPLMAADVRENQLEKTMSSKANEMDRKRSKRFLGFQSQSLRSVPSEFYWEIPGGEGGAAVKYSKRFLGGGSYMKRFLGAGNIKRLQMDESDGFPSYFVGGKRLIPATTDFLGKRTPFGVMSKGGGGKEGRYKIYPLFMYEDLAMNGGKRAMIPTTDFLGK